MPALVEIDRFIEAEDIEGFLDYLKGRFEAYLEGEISDEDLSNLTVHWYATRDGFSDMLVERDDLFRALAGAMDVTHLGFTDEQKRELAKRSIELIDELKA